jgi:predicted GNAT family N-acyltransferase
VQVRLADPQDMAGVYALRHEVFVLGQDVPEELERDEHDDAAVHAVAVRADGGVVGTGRLVGPELEGRADGVATVGRMAVAEAARGTGTGSAVLRALEQRARELGLQGIELHAQVHAQRFYERLGYEAFGEQYLEAGILHVSMRKAL